jgi:UDP-N-acetylmuramoyl-L-alanyl-D-glutamate--2,6-diaminopimelate ligase
MNKIYDLDGITGVTADSRLVKPGSIFVAINATLQDGHKYIDKAIEAGAAVIIHEKEIEKRGNVRFIAVNSSRLALSEIAAQLYPKQPKYILGVTGTSGKSSTVHFVREILKLLKHKSVSIGTLGVVGDVDISSSLTTPSAEELHRILHKIDDNNIGYAALECSSHGIEQDRISSVKFHACGFTNFSQDHLDYHLNMAEYFSSKKRLFDIMEPGYAVLNVDIPEFNDLVDACDKHKIICYGKQTSKVAVHNIIIKSILQEGAIQKVAWQIDGELYESRLNLVGEFQVYNLACAIGLLMSSNIEIKDIMQLLSLLNTVTGRMEMIANYNGAGIFIDYAHKPDALLNILKTLRLTTKNKLWIVFGCGGERDREKRKLMGEIACEYADKVIITDDNPRNENPAFIRQEILDGCNDKAMEIENRKNAINYALSNLNNGDNLVIAGKGHENYQIIGNETIEFSDIAVVKALIAKK